ncbi:hypothetical protein PVAP13_8NG183701 [Panicum virgatum]|uniref:Uncharacterized protein n=1 Tax=Panicum virgatum TaxID=38727 RepID=A0A8T0P4A7_PANVG|nr:hypothetical protein PVAP13_8NG183701 [Panicum virgatum]
MSITTYLPRLTHVILWDLPSCNVLPPLGQLPNLEWLKIDGMGSIRMIDGVFYGGRGAFPRLAYFTLSNMDCLEEWNTPYPSVVDGSNVLAFPKLFELSINHCPLLRFIAFSPPGRHVIICSSDQALLSPWDNKGHVGASSSAANKWLSVASCEAPLHQWSLLRHLPGLQLLEISSCSDLTCGSTDLLQCISSLDTLIVEDCNGTVALPEMLGDLTCLRLLKIIGCPGLSQWCTSKENRMKLAHILEIELDGNRIEIRRPYRRYVTGREQKLKNKGAPTRTMKDLEDTTSRDGVGI